MGHALSQLLGFCAALAAGALLIDISSPTATLGTRAGFWLAWSSATAALVWAGGTWPQARRGATTRGASTSALPPARSLVRAGLIVTLTIVSLVAF